MTLTLPMPLPLSFTFSAPCMPEILNVTQINTTSVNVSFSAPNRAGTTYKVSVVAQDNRNTCTSRGTSCEILDLPCGEVYEVSAIATTTVGDSFPSYSIPLETGREPWKLYGERERFWLIRLDYWYHLLLVMLW